MTDAGHAPSRRVREVMREEGLGGLWWHGLGVTVYRRLALFERPAAARPRGRAPSLPVTVGFLDPGEVDEYARLRPDTPVKEVERRLASGQSCVTVRSKESMVAVRWMSTGFAEFPYLGLSFELAEGLAYVYDVFTEPSFRGRRIGAARGPAYERFFAEESVTSLLGTAWLHNRSGLGFVRGAGLGTIGTVGCLRIGPLRAPVRRIPPGYLGRARRFRPVR